MKKEITELRRYMAEEGVDAYFVPSGDPHGSEYANAHYKTSEYLSGLAAENTALVVTQDEAKIWADGRFFLQAETQLAGSGIELMKMGEEDVPRVSEYIMMCAEKAADCGRDQPYRVGFDGRVVTASFVNKLEQELEGSAAVEFKWDSDLAGKVWKDRPAIIPSKIWELPLSSSGRSSADKVSSLRAEMTERGADCLLISDLMESAWLLNLRGNDILHTPVFFSYIMITQDRVTLYVMDSAFPYSLPDSLDAVDVRNYDDIFSDLEAIPEETIVWLDSNSANYALYMCVRGKDRIIFEPTPAAAAKAVKNETEIRSTINAHIKDGVAVTRFIRWIKEAAGREYVTEISAADKLESFRREQEGCFDISFETIAGYGPDGAVIHYFATPETDREVKPEGLFLVDSGGQYTDGTTDITRTIALGPLTDEMIDMYTRVLKGHIAFSRYEAGPETTHREMDECSRTALREAGCDFNHGVSHGVGHVLSVHEGNAGIKKILGDEKAGLKPGMIMSNEPGVYFAGKYGIRIENEILLLDGGDGRIISEPITFVPYERAAIDVSMLTDDEIDWIDSYHAHVRDLLLPRLEGADAEFLISASEPLTRN